MGATAVNQGAQRATRRKRAAAFVVVLAAATAGCAEQRMARPSPESAPVIVGPAVSSNRTPLQDVYACYRDRLVTERRRPLSVSVGEVRDFTGRASINEGNAITQGGSLMVISALGKLGPSVRLHERFDPRVGELELIYTDRRQLGDGRVYIVPEGNTERRVPWIPYMGGSILRSDYFIVGGITELNYTVSSGGVEFSVNGVGPRARTFTVNIAADLRIVNTRSLVVEHTVSLQKQVVGHEVGFGVFRFFNNDLFDINVGVRNLEPMQLAVRTVLELGTLELVEAVSLVSARTCLDEGVRDRAVSAEYDSRFWRGPLPPPPPEPPVGAEYAPVQIRNGAAAVPPRPVQPRQRPASASVPSRGNPALDRLFMGIGSVPDVPAVVPNSVPSAPPGTAPGMISPPGNGAGPLNGNGGSDHGNGASGGANGGAAGSDGSASAPAASQPPAPGEAAGGDAPAAPDAAQPPMRSGAASPAPDLTNGNAPSSGRPRIVM